MVSSALVFSRYVAVGGLVAFSVSRAGDQYRVRFQVGGPGVFHNVTVRVFGADEPVAPAPRHTMAAGDAPIEWTFRLADPGQAWVMVTWVWPYLQGVESEALAQRLAGGRLYEWRWYSETTRHVRTSSGFAPGAGRGSRCGSCRCTGGGGAPHRTARPTFWVRERPRRRAAENDGPSIRRIACCASRRCRPRSTVPASVPQRNPAMNSRRAGRGVGRPTR